MATTVDVTAVDVATGAAKSWFVQKGYEQIRPLIKALVLRFPGLKPDTPVESVTLEIMSGLPGAIKAAFPRQEKLANIVGDVVREVIQELKTTNEEGGKNTPPAPSGEGKVMRVIPNVWIDMADNMVGYSGDCGNGHHQEQVVTGKKRRLVDGPEKDDTKFATKSGFRQISFAEYVKSGRNPPPAPEVGCTCKEHLEEYRLEFDKQRADVEAAKTGSSKPDKATSTSLTKFVGMARNGEIKGLTNGDVDHFLDLFNRLAPEKRAGLGEVDDKLEAVAVMKARDLVELEGLIAVSKDKRIATGLAAVLNVPSEMVQSGLGLIKGLGKHGAAVASKIPGTTKGLVVDATNFVSKTYKDTRSEDEAKAAVLRAKLEAKKTARAAAKAGKVTP